MSATACTVQIEQGTGGLPTSAGAASRSTNTGPAATKTGPVGSACSDWDGYGSSVCHPPVSNLPASRLEKMKSTVLLTAESAACTTRPSQVNSGGEVLP